jgi:hypothetical protein
MFGQAGFRLSAKSCIDLRKKRSCRHFVVSFERNRLGPRGEAVALGFALAMDMREG